MSCPIENNPSNKFFMVYNFQSKQFDKIYFDQNCHSQRKRVSHSPCKLEKSMERSSEEEYVIPEMEFEPFIPFPEAKSF